MTAPGRLRAVPERGMRRVLSLIQTSRYPVSRCEQPELMDDPSSDRRQLERTLQQFGLINRLFSRSTGLLRRHLLDDMVQQGRSSATVLDVGAGAGDIARRLLQSARRRGLELSITCLDSDRRVVEYARRSLLSEHSITVRLGSIFEQVHHDGHEYDYVICNHFLHHLRDDEIARFLDIAHRITRRRLLANDLLRANWAVLGFRLFAALFLRGSFARHDGVLSIRRGFRPSELRRLVNGSAWADEATVHTAVPGRVYLLGSRSSSSSRALSRSLRSRVVGAAIPSRSDTSD